MNPNINDPINDRSVYEDDVPTYEEVECTGCGVLIRADGDGWCNRCYWKQATGVES